MDNGKNIYFSSKIKNDVNDKIYKEGMLSYLENLDPIELKYSVLPDRMIYDIGDTTSSTVSAANKVKLIQYESSYQFGSITKQPYSSIKDNLMLVYGDSELVQNDIKIFHLTEKKLIHQYFAIPQLDKMFDEDFFNFEWDMHVGQNFSEHRNEYQRDHFIHQIRDMYSMLKLLGRHNFYEASLNIMSNPDCSKISQYTCKKMEQFLSLTNVSRNFLKTVDCGDILSQSANDDTFWKKCDKTLQYNTKSSRRDKTNIYAKAYFLKYVIYGSAILAGLFHDMCYPICHFIGVRNRTSEYNPTMYMYTHNSYDSFDHISSLLRNSLLFMIVDPSEIKKSLEPDGNKVNHGAYSAISFLLQFYNSGIIFSLPVEKQCAIELAAVAIYDHTQQYNVDEYDKNNLFYQPVFRQNPIAFLLRLCDDLQEWDRRYFEISDQRDTPVCSKCLTPSVPEKVGDKLNYSCVCSAQSKKANNSFQTEYFKTRRLCLVTTSDYMTSDILEVSKKENQKLIKEPPKKALRFSVNYDYYRLLLMARINPTYAKYRLKELNSLKKLVQYQDFNRQSDKDLAFDYIYFDYFMTANPILIKVRIFEEYLQINDCLALFIDEFRSNDHIFPRVIQNYNPLLSFKCFDIIYYTTDLYKILSSNAIEFYAAVLGAADKIKYNPKENKNALTQEIVDMFFEADKTSEYYRSIMKELIYDCLLQYSRQFVTEESGKTQLKSFINEEEYYKQYAPDNKDYFYNCVAAYCNSENDFNSYRQFKDDKSNPYIGYFADLHFFELMNEEIQKDKLK